MSDSCSDLLVPAREASKDGLSPRLKAVYDCFHLEYQTEPQFFVKVPGRVNLIGEHVDYCGYPVLPMALEQNILLAVAATGDNFLHLRNINKKYENFKCDLDNFRIEPHSSGRPYWYNYFLCGVKGIIDYYKEDTTQRGMLVIVSGDIPPASGLSSSSALVSAAALSTAHISKMTLSKQSLASISACCERYVGTQGGGMDQAIAFLGKEGCAQHIEFYPELKSQSVTLPPNTYFVVANSLAEMNKAATSDFNERVIECRTACRILAKKFKLNNWQNVTKFIELQSILGLELAEMEQIILETFTKDRYSLNDILEELNVPHSVFLKEFLTPNTAHMNTFKLRQRSLHVIQESIRVQKFRQICEQEGSAKNTLSQLMSHSHQSLRLLYECSHTCLDELVAISEKMGIGARLTGAGWGGCIVAICDSKDQCKAFMEELEKTYYKPHPEFKGNDLGEIMFSTSPQNGAEILLLENNN